MALPVGWALEGVRVGWRGRQLLRSGQTLGLALQDLPPRLGAFIDSGDVVDVERATQPKRVGEHPDIDTEDGMVSAKLRVARDDPCT